MKPASENSWRKFIPSAILLMGITVAAVVTFASGSAGGEGLPQVTMTSGAALALIGLVAGFLGGIIGTGGCSVMLPAIHFWMGYPAPVAVGTTLFAVIFTAISGGYAHLVRKNLDVRATTVLGVSGILGVLAGSWCLHG